MADKIIDFLANRY